MKTLESLTKLFVSNKKKIDELKDQNATAVFEYVRERVSDGEIVKSLRDCDDKDKLYKIQLKRKDDASFFECGEYSAAYVNAYPLKKDGEVAKIGLNRLNVEKIVKVTKK